MRKNKTNLINKPVYQNIIRYEINCQGNKGSGQRGKDSITNLLTLMMSRKNFFKQQ